MFILNLAGLSSVVVARCSAANPTLEHAARASQNQPVPYNKNLNIMTVKVLQHGVQEAKVSQLHREMTHCELHHTENR